MHARTPSRQVPDRSRVSRPMASDYAVLKLSGSGSGFQLQFSGVSGVRSRESQSLCCLSARTSDVRRPSPPVLDVAVDATSSHLHYVGYWSKARLKVLAAALVEAALLREACACPPSDAPCLGG
eukprot:12920471-Alexandrium_andersonii.AAC.1